MLLESGVENGTTIWKPQFLKVPYDNQKVAQDMITGGLLSIAPWFVNSNILTILTGIDCSAKMVELAEKLALEDNVQPKWPPLLPENILFPLPQSGRCLVMLQFLYSFSSSPVFFRIYI